MTENDCIKSSEKTCNAIFEKKLDKIKSTSAQHTMKPKFK